MSLHFPAAFRIAEQAAKILQAADLHACICVCGLQGEPIVHFRMDVVRPFTFHLAMLKARQAAHTGKSTRELRDLYASGERMPEVFGIALEEMVCWAGGVPVYGKTVEIAGALLGGVGISNLHEDQDESFAIDAVRQAGFNTAKV